MDDDTATNFNTMRQAFEIWWSQHGVHHLAEEDAWNAWQAALISNSANQRDVNLLQGLRELCGYIEDSSQAVIQISQDDASREWCLCIGEKTRYHATSFRGVIDEAIATEKQTCEHKERRITGIAELCGSGLDKEKS